MYLRTIFRQNYFPYTLGFPPLVFSVLTICSIKIFNIPGYYSSLLFPISYFLFSLFLVKNQSRSYLVIKGIIASLSLSYIVIIFINQLNFAPESPINLEVWKSVLHIGQPYQGCGIIWLLGAFCLDIKNNFTSLTLLAIFLHITFMIVLWLIGIVDIVLWLGSLILFILSLLSIFTLKKISKFLASETQKDSYLLNNTKTFPDSFGVMLSIFVTLLLLTNLITVRYINLGGFLTTAGLITYPPTFLVSDVISEIYSFKEASKLLIFGFINIIFFLIIIQLALFMPFYGGIKDSYFLFFKFIPGMVFASLVAYIFGQWFDVFIFEWIKGKTSGHYLWLRNNLATILSQLIDTFLFGFIVWVLWPLMIGENMSIELEAWKQITFNELFIKIVIALFDTPFLYIILFIIRGEKSRKSSR